MSKTKEVGKPLADPGPVNPPPPPPPIPPGK